MIDYTQYTVEDFVLDESFWQWVKHPDATSEAFWNDWLQAHPDKQSTVAQARLILSSIDFDQKLTGDEKTDMWNYIQNTIREEAPVRPMPVSPDRSIGWPVWQRMAAGFAGVLLLAGVLFYFIAMQKHAVSTGYGEIRKVILPDGSVVTMNANSRLTYGREWNAQQDREVWLDGEAFFSVTHTASHQRFRVHTPDLNVEVLGTQFNVFKRAGKTKVSLNSGKVRIRIHAQTENHVLMKPGELVEYSEKQHTYVKKAVNAEKYSAWTQRRLIFDDTPMSEIIQMLHDNYGWKVEVKDTIILSERLTGEIQTSDELTLLKALAKALEVKITKENNTLVVEKP